MFELKKSLNNIKIENADMRNTEEVFPNFSFTGRRSYELQMSKESAGRKRTSAEERQKTQEKIRRWWWGWPGVSYLSHGWFNTFLFLSSHHLHLRNECLYFLGSWVMNRSPGQTNRMNRKALRFIPQEPGKKTLIPYIYNATNETLSKILWEMIYIHNFSGNWHLTLFDVFITTHVICPTADLLVDRGSSGIDSTNFRMVLQRKYNTLWL